MTIVFIYFLCKINSKVETMGLCLDTVVVMSPVYSLEWNDHDADDEKFFLDSDQPHAEITEIVKYKVREWIRENDEIDDKW